MGMLVKCDVFRRAVLVRLDRVHDATPNLEIDIFGDLDRFVEVVLGMKRDAPGDDAESFDAEFVVEAGDDDVAVVGFDRAIDDQDRAGIDAGVDHRIARDAHVEGRDRVFDEVACEV